MKNEKLLTLTPNVMVDDIDATINFYRDILGFKVVMSVPDKGALDWVMLGYDDIFLMFQSARSMLKEYPMFNNKPIGGSLLFYITVKNVDLMYERIKNSVKIVKNPHVQFYGAKEFAIEDNNGLVLVFAQKD
jgi:lactoylglutathione lyase